MFLKTARDIAKPQHFAILDRLKRSTGMPVGELAAELKLSYMGVKQHCIELERKGFLDTWRRRTGAGRPEMLYRLTAKASALYPDAGNEMTLGILQAIQQVYGPSAPEKLLFSYFMTKAGNYRKKIGDGSLAVRARLLARIRNREGYCAGVEWDQESGFRIVEFHSLEREIADAYPSVRQMETRMFCQVLNTEVHREEETASGLIRTSWCIPALADAGAALPPPRPRKSAARDMETPLLPLAC